MFESKYSKILTVILVILIVAILGLLGFLGYDWYQKYYLDTEALAFVENYTEGTNDETENNAENNTENTTNTNNNTTVTNPIDNIDKTNTISGSNTTSKPTYKGFNVVGAIEIPATNVNYPILEEMNTKSLETSVVFLYGAGINQVGNTVIAGHNYRNGLFFSNNKKLNIGDKIYLTDNSKNRVKYIIYDKFETTSEDADFYSRDTNGKPEVTLTTCNDNSSKRLILLARPE